MGHSNADTYTDSNQQFKSQSVEQLHMKGKIEKGYRVDVMRAPNKAVRITLIMCGCVSSLRLLLYMYQFTLREY